MPPTTMVRSRTTAAAQLERQFALRRPTARCANQGPRLTVPPTPAGVPPLTEGGLFGGRTGCQARAAGSGVSASADRIALQERPHRRHDHLVLVFQHVVVGVFERGDLGLRQRLAEAFQKVLVEAEI